MFDLNTSSFAECFITKSIHVQEILSDGFKRVCEVWKESTPKKWFLINADKNILFSTHTSWVYVIVIADHVYKLGQTSVPLGIPSSKTILKIGDEFHIQPKVGTTSRLGRLISGDDTDQKIREALTPYLKDGESIQIWAKSCPINHITVNIGGQTKIAISTHQEEIEGHYFDFILEKVGALPPGNPIKK